MKTSYSSNNNPRVIIIQKLYGKFLNDEEKLIDERESVHSTNVNNDEDKSQIENFNTDICTKNKDFHHD